MGLPIRDISGQGEKLKEKIARLVSSSPCSNEQNMLNLYWKIIKVSFCFGWINICCLLATSCLRWNAYSKLAHANQIKMAEIDRQQLWSGCCYKTEMEVVFLYYKLLVNRKGV